MGLVLYILIAVHLGVFVHESKFEENIKQGFWTVLIILSVLVVIFSAINS